MVLQYTVKPATIVITSPIWVIGKVIRRHVNMRISLLCKLSQLVNHFGYSGNRS